MDETAIVDGQIEYKGGDGVDYSIKLVRLGPGNIEFTLHINGYVCGRMPLDNIIKAAVRMDPEHASGPEKQIQALRREVAEAKAKAYDWQAKAMRLEKNLQDLNADDNSYSVQERQEMLEAMRRASVTFYAAAVNTRVHGFIEFTGLMNEFIKLCEEADQQGIDWIFANVHGDKHLPFKPYHVAYLSEKLQCIYGKRLQLVDND